MSGPESPPPGEADVATPPRGAAAQQVWGAAPSPRPRSERREHRNRVLWVVVLVVGLVATGWFSSEYYRDVWPQAAPRDPVPVAADGSASLAGITVSLVEATDLGAAPALGDTDWSPPAGFHAWRVVLETSSTNEDVFTCDVALVDTRGRQFWANYFVESFAEGYEWSYTCGATEPEDDVGPQQALLVLVPQDADVRTVRVWNTALEPDFIELDL